ncbi:MAG: response regulator transcription factor [bacterium]|nr:response regulator transcription factor [bacterium]
MYQAKNGIDFINQIPMHILPDIVITDIRMPKMNGFEVIEWMKSHYPKIPIIAISFNNDADFILKLLAAGFKGNIIKGNEEYNIIDILNIVLSGGTHFEKPEQDILIEPQIFEDEKTNSIHLSEEKKQFLEKLIDKDTLKDVANEMHISYKTAERWRTIIFNTFNVKSKFELLKKLIRDKLYRT